uniref:Uncharacterized protein n=1 Tax=Arundo donax TaxID=35708 RepID=A0A0A9GZX0_ARUDO
MLRQKGNRGGSNSDICMLSFCLSQNNPHMFFSVVLS